MFFICKKYKSTEFMKKRGSGKTWSGRAKENELNGAKRKFIGRYEPEKVEAKLTFSGLK